MPGERTYAVQREAPLLAWLIEELKPMSRSAVKSLLSHRCISVNGTATTQFDHALKIGDRVVIAREGAKSTAGLPIVFEDEDLIAINKPAGLLTVATDSEKAATAFVLLKEQMASGRPFVVHRLDRETSGLLLFAKSEEIRDRLQANWADVQKHYWAIVNQPPKSPNGVVRSYLKEGRDLRVRTSPNERPGSQLAITHYETIETRGELCLLSVRLETGRKHQIRVHLAQIGRPIAGDPIYGGSSGRLRRLGLHAKCLKFAHPRHGGMIEITSQLPADLRRLFPAN